MAKRMLIDATHPDETRVVVLSGKSVEEFDYETANKAQIKGNIYLAKVTRVEPSLQAAFIDYGGNRHGFLPFSEIHPDYYRIPIADREALIAEEARLRGESLDDGDSNGNDSNGVDSNGSDSDGETEDEPSVRPARRSRRGRSAAAEEDSSGDGDENGNGNGGVEEIAQEIRIDTVGGEEVEDPARRRAQLLRRYKIQEVIKRRQVMLVQVTKEERGNKGAALTTYLSLAGRYCVLMPNTAKGGGISRKIANAADRRRLKSVVGEMSIPEGMAVIVRTAGSERTKAEIKRDYEYLIRLWDDIRGKTLQSTAPCLIHEEASLIKRAIRDLYDRDMDEVLVEGAEGYKNAKDFMKMLMPSHARKVKPYVEATMPLFHRYQVESQLDAMYSPQVQLRSGGSIVINPTEALVAIDVNSGRSTRERHIEETALKTNLEAAEEVARQLRLRDLAGLIVIDFIDMEEPRHNREVERRLKEAMKTDRARIQLGRISPFGLLELSRQRLRPSLFETAMMQCHRCNATGYVRAPDAAGLVVLRALTEEGVRKGGGEIEARVPLEVALNMLNEKRDHVVELEQRFGLVLTVKVGEHMGPADFEIVRHSTEASPLPPPRVPAIEEEDEVEEEPLEARESETEEENGARRRPRHRRGGGRRDREEGRPEATEPGLHPEEPEDEELAAAEGEASDGHPGGEEESDEERKGKRRRRGRRGGRRRSRRRTDEAAEGQVAELAEVSDGQTAAQDEEAADVAEPETAAEVDAPTAEAEWTPLSEEAATAAEAPAPAAEAETPSTEVAEAAAVEPEPKKPVRRSRARKPKPEAAAEAAAEPAEQVAELPSEQAVEAPAEEPVAAEAAPAKPVRRRRKPAAKAAEQPEPQPEAETEAAAPEPSTAVPSTAAPATAAPSSAEPAPAEADRKLRNGADGEAQAPVDLPEETGERVGALPASDEQDDRPRRKGWWNRLMS